MFLRPARCGLGASWAGPWRRDVQNPMVLSVAW